MPMQIYMSEHCIEILISYTEQYEMKYRHLKSFILLLKKSFILHSAFSLNYGRPQCHNIKKIAKNLSFLFETFTFKKVTLLLIPSKHYMCLPPYTATKNISIVIYILISKENTSNSLRKQLTPCIFRRLIVIAQNQFHKKHTAIILQLQNYCLYSYVSRPEN